MKFFQILECNEILGNCCNDYGLVMIIDVARKFFDVFG